MKQKKKTIRTLLAGFAGIGMLMASLALPAQANALSATETMAAPAYTFSQTAAPCSDAGCIIDRYINPAIALLSATVSVIIVISIVAGGIQYSAAGGDPSKVGAAKSRIAKALGALFFFFFLYAFLNYIVPGGVGQ